MIVFLGAASVILFMLGMLHDSNWAPPFIVRWGFLWAAFIVASFRLVSRAETARTADSINVLVFDAENIRERIISTVERFGWPVYKDDGRKMPIPFTDYNLSKAEDQPVLYEMAKLRARILDHNRLLGQVLSEHGICFDMNGLLDPDQLKPDSAFIRVDEYVNRIRALAMPPKSLVESWSVRRFQR